MSGLFGGGFGSGVFFFGGVGFGHELGEFFGEDAFGLVEFVSGVVVDLEDGGGGGGGESEEGGGFGRSGREEDGEFGLGEVGGGGW